MVPWLSEQFGNASSRHEYGRAARRAVDEARNKVATAIGAHSTEVVFTSNGSEANNLMLKGTAACMKTGVVAISAIEHPSVIKPAEQLARRGWQVQKLTVDRDGRIDAHGYLTVMAQEPKLVSVMLANNETGVLQDVITLAAQARAAGAVFHTDAVQALGKLPAQGFEVWVTHQVNISALTGVSPGMGEFSQYECSRSQCADPFIAQDRRAKGSCRARTRQARRNRTADCRRWAGTRLALGHGECGGDRRIRCRL